MDLNQPKAAEALLGVYSCYENMSPAGKKWATPTLENMIRSMPVETLLKMPEILKTTMPSNLRKVLNECLAKKAGLTEEMSIS